MRITLALIFLLLVVAGAGKDSAYCRQIFSQMEQQEERELNARIMTELSSTLQKEDLYLRKMLSSDLKSMHSLNQLAHQKTVEFNSIYLNIIGALFICFFTFYSLLILIRVYKSSNTLEKVRSKKIAIKFSIFLLTILCVLVLTQSLTGLNEVSRQQTTINHIMCRFLEEPKGFIVGQNFAKQEGYEATYKYLDQALINYQNQLKIPMSDQYFKLRPAKYVREVFNLILSSLPPSEQGFSQDIKWRMYEMEVAHAYSQKASWNYCQSDIFSITEQIQAIIKQIKIFTDTVYNDDIVELSIGYIIFLTSRIGYFCFISITAFIVYFAFAAFMNKLQMQSSHLLCLQFFITIMALVCAFVFLILPYFITHLYWTHNGIMSSTQNDDNFRGLIKIIFPNDEGYQYPARDMLFTFHHKTFLQLGVAGAINNLEHFHSLMKHYQDKNDDYIYNIFELAFDKIEDPGKKEELKRVMNNYNVKRPLVPAIKQVYESQEYFLSYLRDGGYLRAFNPSALGLYFKEVSLMASSYLINRAYTMRQICGNISILLLIMLLFSFNFPKYECIKDSFFDNEGGMIENTIFDEESLAKEVELQKTSQLS